MSTKTIASDAKIKLIPNTSRYSIGHTCPKCGCDDWRKLGQARQVTLNKTKYECWVCTVSSDALRIRKARYRNIHQDSIKESRTKYTSTQIATSLKKARAAKRRATKLNSTPHWLTKKDLEKIKKIYEDCPSGYQVDHILPLQGKHICGLHTPSNLQYLPASENASKCNREPDWTKKWQPGLHP